MSDELVTIANVPTAMEASFLRSKLEEAGVRAFVADDMVGALGALGGLTSVKVQVASSDARLALAILNDTSSSEDPDPFETEAPVDAFSDRPTRATAFTDEEPDDADEEDETDEGPPLNAREEAASRALVAALLGFAVCPLQLYASWLLWKVYVSEEPLGDGARWRAWVALLINLPVLFALALIVRSWFIGDWD